MSPRRYSSPLRDAEAARTRRRIVEAAGALFARDGYAATTMKAIADRAGVSVQSVHLAGPKAALLIAAFEVSFAGDEGRHSLADRPALVEIMARESLDDVLAGWLDYVAAANARTAGLSRAMLTASEMDAAAAEAVADLEARRRRDLRQAAEWLAGRGLLRPDDVPRAGDELNLVVGPEAHDFLVLRSGWSPSEYRRWMEDTVRSLLARWAGAAG
ncbi:TetR/AcrR family transcriptional regulator [Microbacterium sp. SORGH_AS_0888]|uniref:TetR/AcrR family transcriptional regulator n=1 Tax=Microbacterium sp. SORGH_AS_0888 TaxID=3041791 RepID=UPI002786867E|nr:TetR/AcrR family transcriptional regulator [Microbacterium sp. SORGH_AS_0888]MDQ1129488.1 AcrR family transcriptional regulator [Microbacterium sp. SORGH_AS_0888]